MNIITKIKKTCFFKSRFNECESLLEETHTQYVVGDSTVVNYRSTKVEGIDAIYK